MIDPGNTPEMTALIEAHEEAGIEGRLLDPSIGTYRYKKWRVRFLVVVYVMEVLEEHAGWEEDWIRERKWAPFGTAMSLLVNHPVRPLLERAKSLAAGRIV
jgi:phosphohistidine phosphatase